MRYWILEGQRPVPTPDLYAWGAWFETADRRVAYTDLTPTVAVSTVFLASDHRITADGPPILFETMVFGLDDGAEVMERYATWTEAAQGHETICAQMRIRLHLPSQGAAPAHGDIG